LRRHNDEARIVFTSSRSVLGDIPKPILAGEDLPYNPLPIYAVHKAYGELLCRSFDELYGMKITILRPSNVYGPRQPYWVKGWYNFISYWIQLALRDRPIPIYGSGRQIRDYTYVEDISRAYPLALDNPRAVGETFLLASGRGVDLLTLARTIIGLTKSRSEMKFLPARKGDVKRFVGNPRKAREVLDWSSRTPLAEGLKAEVAWVKRHVKGKY